MNDQDPVSWCPKGGITMPQNGFPKISTVHNVDSGKMTTFRVEPISVEAEKRKSAQEHYHMAANGLKYIYDSYKPCKSTNRNTCLQLTTQGGDLYRGTQIRTQKNQPILRRVLTKKQLIESLAKTFANADNPLPIPNSQPDSAPPTSTNQMPGGSCDPLDNTMQIPTSAAVLNKHVGNQLVIPRNHQKDIPSSTNQMAMTSSTAYIPQSKHIPAIRSSPYEQLTRRTHVTTSNQSNLNNSTISNLSRKNELHNNIPIDVDAYKEASVVPSFPQCNNSLGNTEVSTSLGCKKLPQNESIHPSSNNNESLANQTLQGANLSSSLHLEAIPDAYASVVGLPKHRLTDSEGTSGGEIPSILSLPGKRKLDLVENAERINTRSRLSTDKSKSKKRNCEVVDDLDSAEWTSLPDLITDGQAEVMEVNSSDGKQSGPLTELKKTVASVNLTAHSLLKRRTIPDIVEQASHQRSPLSELRKTVAGVIPSSEYIPPPRNHHSSVTSRNSVNTRARKRKSMYVPLTCREKTAQSTHTDGIDVDRVLKAVSEFTTPGADDYYNSWWYYYGGGGAYTSSETCTLADDELPEEVKTGVGSNARVLDADENFFYIIRDTAASVKIHVIPRNKNGVEADSDDSNGGKAVDNDETNPTNHRNKDSETVVINRDRVGNEKDEATSSRFEANPSENHTRQLLLKKNVDVEKVTQATLKARETCKQLSDIINAKIRKDHPHNKEEKEKPNDKIKNENGKGDDTVNSGKLGLEDIGQREEWDRNNANIDDGVNNNEAKTLVENTSINRDVLLHKNNKDRNMNDQSGDETTCLDEETCNQVGALFVNNS